jgi:hypothetical protein
MTIANLTSGWGEATVPFPNTCPQVLLDYPAITGWNQLDENNPPTPASVQVWCDPTTLAAIQADPKYSASVGVIEA